MNKATRNHIATYTDEKLEEDINRYYLSLSNTGRNIRQVRISINKKINALLDEKQGRMIRAMQSKQ